MSKLFSQDLFSLDGKLAVVTGGCGNLGPWWVKALSDFGAKVAIIDLHDVNIPAELKNKKDRIKIYYGDITDTKNLSKIHKKINKDSGLVDILVNNAGIDAPPIKQTSKVNEESESIKSYKKMWSVNVQGLVNCIEQFSIDMRKKKQGSIVNIGSLYMERSPYEGLYTHLNFDKPWAYGATKAAVGQVTRHFATRLSKFGIRINTLSPGGVLGNQDQEFVRKFSQRVPLGRMAYKDKDLAGPLVFLASDASSYVTGINLQINGGYLAW